MINSREYNKHMDLLDGATDWFICKGYNTDKLEVALDDLYDQRTAKFNQQIIINRRKL